ncbi:hypothetical protein KVV02_007542 [Mortierella alpina]|uniref:Uncharacterized protein n=1 Tax=Mortierella alpina TaxID=64518 RepID=A0A9P8AAJ1_MORAP|nr:hypothetical protein KVV02_007542 [Mortierella alpina]
MALSHAQPAPLHSPFNKRNQYHSTLELGGHSSSEQSLASLSQRLFYFSAYSSVGTALMGASISVVILQSRQLYFLNLINHTSATAGPATTPSAITYVDTAHTVLQSVASLLRTAWLPVTVWALALISTTTLWSGVMTTTKRKQQQQHLLRMPSFSSLRTSLLLSHLLYGVFWVLLSAIQETQERLFLSPSWSTMAQTRAAAGGGGRGGGRALMFFSGSESSVDLSIDNNNNNYHAQDDGMGSRSSQQVSKHHQQALDYDTSRSLALQSTALPLCVVWYGAIIALGVATGLLATCSGLIEKRLQDEYDERWVALQEQDLGSAGKGVGGSLPTSRKRAAMARQFSMAQKLTLGLLVLVTFTMEMGFFQWMLSAAVRPMALAESSSSNSSNRSGPLSTSLCLVGLFWTTTMMTLGARLVPVSRS